MPTCLLPPRKLQQSCPPHDLCHGQEVFAFTVIKSHNCEGHFAHHLLTLVGYQRVEAVHQLSPKRVHLLLLLHCGVCSTHKHMQTVKHACCSCRR